MTDVKGDKKQVTKQLLKPSEYMRLRRPEQFSDTETTSEPYLDKGYFEYHLETLTSRGEEKVFEHFARKICEVLICPNLIPQTGPTGGGDSKVDTENIPVGTNQTAKRSVTRISTMPNQSKEKSLTDRLN